eukprot:TRINITY_DN63130_c0_g1_i1.p1 TRINITY_DN63130_c0_g1~~TRINITY_DN63130_c0_g1_i1.p1  ORF type:complete len:358 (-),score=66.38 TRINITY_DN63130_c0_g1_i1:103-1095(-)
MAAPLVLGYLRRGLSPLSNIVPSRQHGIAIRCMATQKPFSVPKREDQVLLGCVSYDPAISTIWGLMKDYLVKAGVNFDFVLFTNYEQQVRALVAGQIDIAWNGPIAHVMTQQLADAHGVGPAVSLGMRDVDCDFVSVVAVRKEARITRLQDLVGKDIMSGASDSPQAHLVPLHWLRSKGVIPKSVQAFDLDLGKHGDTAAGEVKALEALASDTSKPAAVLSKMMWDRGVAGQLPSVNAELLSARVELLTGPGNEPPLFDHCQFDSLPSLPAWKRDSFSEAVFKMDWNNPEHQEVMRLEGIQRTWKPHREEGYEVVRKALKAANWSASSSA